MISTDVVDRLVASGAAFHGRGTMTPRNLALSEDALRLIAERVEPGHRTLETGVGYSTVVFAACGSWHTAVAPFAVEHDRVRAWCTDQGITTDHLESIVSPSQDVLPGLASGEPLDFVLVDGDHAFPVPFIDWYFTAVRLRAGGYLMVDDTHIRTGEILREFLKSERDRWRLVAELPTSALFERADGPLVHPRGWLSQPFCATPRPLGPRWAAPIAAVRQRVRLRSRLRAVVRRSITRGSPPGS